MSILLSCLFFGISASAAETHPKRELRAVWMTPLVGDISLSGKAATSQKNITTALDKLQGQGVNAVFIHARVAADRLYEINTFTDASGNTYTVYEPTSNYVTSDGKRNGTMAYDVFAYFIEQAHARGIEVHAWVNPYRYYNCSTDLGRNLNSALCDARSCSLDKGPWTKGWIIHYKNGDGTCKYTFDPSLEASKTRICNVIGVLTGAYDIDGIVFDDYFYPDYIPKNSSADDWTNYKNSGTSMSIADWRRSHVNDMVKRCYETIKSIKPWVRFGIAPAGAGHNGMKDSDGLRPMSDYCSASDWQYDALFSDPMAWLRDKSIDYISPQLYWRESHSTNAFTPMCKWWSQIPGAFGRHFFPSVSTTDTPAKETHDMCGSNRIVNRDGNFGFVGYSYINTGSAFDLLKADLWSKPSLIPPMTWFDAPDPGKITGLSKSGNTLSWTAKSNMRYIVYAIPMSVSLGNITSKDGGLLADYIIDITYSNKTTIPSGYRTNYYYAVAPYDRYGNEWPYSLQGAPLPDAEVTLASPANGITMADGQSAEFSWSGTSGATFTLQMATDAAFSNIVLTKSGADLRSVVIAASELPAGTIYWRVSATRSGYNSATSQVRYFTVADRPLDIPALFAPADNEHLESDVNFVVQHVNAETYILEISRSQSFDKMYYTGSALWKDEYDENSKIWKQYTVPLATFSDGTYYWRVRASSEGYSDTYSEVRVFTVGDADAGGSSYIPYRDPYQYDEKVIGNKRFILTNLWLRNSSNNVMSVSADYSRGMTLHHADEYCGYDAVVVANRDKGAGGWLELYDVRTGEKKQDISLAFDSSYPTGLYQTNGVLSDDNNNVLVHNLALAGGAVGIAHVNLEDVAGNCKTIFNATPGYRVDHLDVYGNASRERNTVYYVFLIGTPEKSNTKITRYTVNGSAITATDEISLSGGTGNAAYIRAVNSNSVYVDGRGIAPMLVQFNTRAETVVGTQFAGAEPNVTGIVHFIHDGTQYTAVRNADNGRRWCLVSGSNLTTAYTGTTLQWTFPNTALGSTSNTNDPICPVDVLQSDYAGNALYSARSDASSSIICGYSPSDKGMAAYALTARIVTGVEGITAPDESADFDPEAPAEYYNLQGQRVDAENLRPGLYLIRQGRHTYKTLVR